MFLLRKFLNNWEDITGILSLVTLSFMLFRFASII
ncbi:MAG: hypothetical protein CM15mP111_2920 [Hyphomicrobiales bacterium]|nr:MAG: hypothetical protein CM15mP111_2920 [Hyphomicrobiales bacterium]